MMDKVHLINLALKLNSICSALLGFSLYGRFVHCVEDYRLVADMLRKFRVFIVLTRLVYLSTRYLGLSYFIVNVAIITYTRTINCNVASTFVVSMFYVLHLGNHWLFASRLMAIWHTHNHSILIYAYVLLGFAGLVAINVLCFLRTKGGTRIAGIGCVFLTDMQTLPPLGYSLAMCICGFSYHTLNMLLAILRLSTFREGDSIDDTSITWIKFVATWKSLLQRNSTSRVALAQDLIEQGVQYWVARTILVSTMVFMPRFALKGDPLAIMGCFAIFIAIDIELAGAIYRATVKAAYTNRSTVDVKPTKISSIRLATTFDLSTVDHLPYKNETPTSPGGTNPSRSTDLERGGCQ